MTPPPSSPTDADWGPPERAQVALLADVGAAPKPGNVDRDHDHPDLRLGHFLAGGVGAGVGLRAAAVGDPVGAAFERAVAGMSRGAGTNTQFGSLLLLVPLVRAAAASDRDLSPDGAAAVVASTTVADAAAFYRAFDHVDVAVPDPPEGIVDLDVRRGAEAIPTLEARGVTLSDVFSRTTADSNATEWTTGFRRTFETAAGIVDDDGPLTDRVARAFLDRLATDEDTLIRTVHGAAVATEVRKRAAAARGDSDAVAALDADLLDRGINPGATADLVTAATFVALERGVSV
ncbi:2-(5''-triphosphoribosyl)-3'-dephosphocoenzyme-A synthase [Halobellus salinus]|uniref:2-(5''-triphosphoribosyl)-3'-dephosphocoenzyme-A synthase n=1 Tax=Halobellus salinus TaxID=931585 RepID=A0A830ELE2_9EURY|nr:triphosphoribosyl-dephospho-CoA synthase [Halobellus salinus]GGJ16864.1 2-(5''-triphosphoribosyl)-3'-dephosphocoenzyme-A synthase [Halobellus salinus]SMP31537.1 triphosphoribosyl-dephospho-CoA synthase [Halobellus salinus]